MKFKFVSRNAFRDLARNLRRIVISKANAEEKDEQFRRLYEQLKPQLRENTRLLNNQTAFSSRCQHWNQLDSRLYKPVKNVKNPWLTLKREFEQALKTTNNEELGTRVSKSVAWFYNTPYLDYWVVDR
tara:strand:+ start:68 stop:451 length:384 start_codon:yes stop_codon:yes gene_type:complete